MNIYVSITIEVKTMKKRITAFFLAFLINCIFLPNLSVFAVGEVNLAKDVKYSVSTGEPITLSYSGFSENGEKFETDNGQLSDGKLASASRDEGAWYRAYRGKSRTVVFDLSERVAVTGIKASFLNDKNEKITAPRYIKIFLSDDGVRYASASEQTIDYNSNVDEPTRAEFAVKLLRTYAARYVKIEYSVDVFSYCDEIEILGRKMLNGRETKVNPTNATQSSSFLTSVSGVTSIVKLNNGYIEDTSDISFTEEKLLPYVAYVGINGELTGKMFDSILLSPFKTAYPSGGTLFADVEKSAVMSDFELYFDYIFKDGGDLSVLDQTVGKAYAALGIKDKFKVFLSLPYPNVSETPFGDINSDGSDENSKTREERTAIAKWYINKCISAFLNNEYKNLTLAGFSWCCDEVEFSNSDHELEFIQNVNRYITQKRVQPILSFGYLHGGFDMWKELRFGGALMSSGYSDPENGFPREMLAEYSGTLKNNSLGTEIELPSESRFGGDDYESACTEYENNLFYGYKTGYMASLKMFSESGDSAMNLFCRSDISTPKGIYLRRLYDMTYSFLRNTYKNKAPTISVSDLELIYGEERIMTEITVEDSDSHWDDLLIQFTEKPKNGKVTVSADKTTLIFHPDTGFIGEDSFSVRVTDGFNVSDEIKVTVTVKNDAVSDTLSPETSDSDMNESPNEEEKISVPPWLMILVIVLMSAMIAVAVAVIIKSLKKN